MKMYNFVAYQWNSFCVFILPFTPVQMHQISPLISFMFSLNVT